MPTWHDAGYRGLYNRRCWRCKASSRHDVDIRAYFSGLITVTPGEDVRKGGINFFDDTFCLKKIVEKPSDAQLDHLRADGWLKEGDPIWYNAGIYIFKPVLFEHTAKLQKSPRGEYELTDAIETMIDAGEPSAGAKIEGRWVDVRDPEVLESLG